MSCDVVKTKYSADPQGALELKWPLRTVQNLGQRLPLWLSWYQICLQCRRPRFDSWVWKIPGKRDRPPTPVSLGFPYGSAGNESTCNAGDLGSIPGIGLGRFTGEGKGYPLQYSGLENSMDYIVHEVA